MNRAGSANPRKPRGTSRSHVGENLVDELIAIIVDAIADFLRGLSGYTRWRNPVLASGYGDLTRAHAARDGSNVIVDNPVAIVIETIAEFAHGRHVTDATPPHPEITQLLSDLASPDIQRFGGARVTALFRAVQTGTTIVDHPVAIFIDHSVADFDIRQSGLTRILRATGDRDLASSNAAGLRRNAVINHSIAVVVEVIACFGFGAMPAAIDFDFVGILLAVGTRRGNAFFIGADAARTRRSVGARLSVRTRFAGAPAAIDIGLRTVLGAVAA